MTVRRVPDRDPAFLRYVESLGLLPGAVVELRAREPFSGPLTVRVGGAERIIGHELASQLKVEPVATRLRPHAPSKPFKLHGPSVREVGVTRTVLPGRPFPLGATLDADGVNFAIYSENASEVELCLFDDAEAPGASRSGCRCAR